MIGGIEMIIGVKFCFEVFIVVSIWLMEPGIGSDSFFKMDEICVDFICWLLHLMHNLCPRWRSD